MMQFSLKPSHIFFSNYDAASMLVKAGRTRLFQRLRQAYVASHNETLT